MENIDETSPEFEPINSILVNENSNDESISGMSDLVSVGSPTQFISKENHDTNSNGFEVDKSLIEKSEETILDENGFINHKSDSTNIEAMDIEISNNTDKLSTDDLKSKNNHHSSKNNKNINSQEKSNRHRSKDRNSSNHRSTSGENNDIKKNSSSHKRHHSSSKDKNKKHKRVKKSHHSDCDRTSKRDRKDSRSDKKEKSSSLCKEPKLLNGNRSDDESNAGGSSKQKSSIHKNKSSTSDKSKSSSSNHKSNRKDNSSKDVDDKLKEKSSSSKNSRTSINHKNNKIKKKKDKNTLKEESKLPADDLNIEKNPKWIDFRSSFITNDEQDAANVLLSMSEIPYDNSMNEIRTENIILLENSSTVETIKSSNITHNKLEIQESINQTKTLQCINNDKIKENLNLNLEIPQSLNINNVCEDSIPKMNTEECYVKMVDIGLCNDIKIKNSFVENMEITESKQDELMLNEKEQNTLNVDLNLKVSQIANSCNSIVTLKVPKLKLKLPKEIDSFAKNKRKKHKYKNNNNKKFKSSKNSSDEINTVTINLSETINCKQNCHNLNNVLEINEHTSTSHQMLHEENENDIKTIDDQSFNTFKGFSQIDAIPCKNYDQLFTLLNKLQNEINDMTEGFKGFTEFDVKSYVEYKNYHVRKIKNCHRFIGFIGFTEKDKEVEKKLSNKYKAVKQQSELAKKQNYLNNHQENITCGNVVQNGKKLNKVMAVIYENNKDNNLNTNENYSQPNINKNDCPVVNNNNRDIKTSDDWVAKQETKYKLLPLKVKLERLMEIRCNSKNILFISSLILI